MENYYAKLTHFNKFIPLLLRSEDLSKMEQDELNIFLLKYIPAVMFREIGTLQPRI